MVVHAVAVHDGAAFAAFRGEDARIARSLLALSRGSSPQRAVLFYHGFEGIKPWQFALQDGGWEELPPAPSPPPPFKFFDATGMSTPHPNRTLCQQVTDLRNQINAASNRGYAVRAASGFLASEKAWVSGSRAVVPSSVPDAMRRIFDQIFHLTPAYGDPWFGQHSFVTRNTNP